MKLEPIANLSDLDKLKEGDLIKVHFLDESIKTLEWLLKLNERGFIAIGDIGVVQDIIIHDSWFMSVNQYFDIKIVGNWDEGNVKLFKDILKNSIDKLDVIPSKIE